MLLEHPSYLLSLVPHKPLLHSCSFPLTMLQQADVYSDVYISAHPVRELRWVHHERW